MVFGGGDGDGDGDAAAGARAVLIGRRPWRWVLLSFVLLVCVALPPFFPSPSPSRFSAPTPPFACGLSLA